MDEIAQEAGIAKGTLYLYFKDKEDLICSTLISVLDDIKERMMERIFEDMDPVETLGEIARALFEYFSENNEFYNVYLTILNYNLVSNYAALFERMLARKKELYHFESQLVDAAKGLGSIRRDLATEDIVMAFDGIVMNIIDQMFFPGRGAVRFWCLLFPPVKPKVVCLTPKNVVAPVAIDVNDLTGATGVW